MDESSELRLQLKRDFSDFLDQDHGQGQYLAKIDRLVESFKDTGALRLEVDMNDLFNYTPELHQRVLQEPGPCLRPFEEALEELIRNHHPKTLGERTEVRVAFTGEFGRHRVSPRQLLSPFVSQLVCVEGIVTKASLVRPKWVRSVHFCEATGQTITREYRDVTSNAGPPTGANFPTRDENGNLLETQFGESTFRDQQVLTIQELPETAPAGQLPRSCEVILEDDLVDRAKPGDRVAVVGEYKAVPPQASGTMSGLFRAMVIANSVQLLAQDASTRNWTPADIRNIKELAKAPDCLAQLGASLAPSIYGHTTIKQALVLLLLGGRERNLDNGGHLRGDINCLMVGDPGVAKSQLLRAVMHVAPLAVSTTGRGSSGVGLTAAVTTDADTGERRLEAGAMVLADRGVVCIDEFDKMNDSDRVAIHEVMEQQTVTIAKAGIHTALNARCSVVAAANPLYGTYDHNMSVTRNVNLPDSLLSRFDLLFIVLDNMDSAMDRKVAEHVLGQHRFRPAGGPVNLSDAEQARMDEEEGPEGGVTEMRVKHDRRLHGEKQPGAQPPLTTAFLKKFIQYAKNRYKDVALTGEAMEAIGDFYAELRAASDAHALPVTVRTLETIIRLSSAAAKCRLSGQVKVEDVAVARSMLGQAMDLEVPTAGQAATRDKRPANTPQKRPRGGDGANDGDEDDDQPGPGAAAAGDVEMEDAAPAATVPPSTSTAKPAAAAAAAAAGPSGEAGAGVSSESLVSSGQVQTVALAIKEMMTAVVGDARDSLPLAELMSTLQAKRIALSKPQVVQALEVLAEEEAQAKAGLIVRIMFDRAEGVVYNSA